MKAGSILPGVVSVLLVSSLSGFTGEITPMALAIKSAGPRLELAWPAAVADGAQELVYPEYEVQSSRDLTHWKSLGGKVRGLSGRSGPLLSLSLDSEPGPAFYRLTANPEAQDTNRMADGGAEIFGYNARFAAELAPLGLLPLEDFATNGAGIPYLPRLTWDPTTAQFWTNFDSTGFFYARYGGNFDATNLPYNFHLDDQELPRFLTNGFVVSERLGSVSFGDLYYRLFNADLPVFITADSVLHAWHRSYQTVLEELEELQLSTLLERVVSGMSLQLPPTWQQYGSGPLSQSILDADHFLTVARSLWATQQVASTLGDPGVNQQVKDTLAAIDRLALERVVIFGSSRVVDFSQFKVRGHYTGSERLARYFRAMMWCGRTDLRLATFPPNKEDDIRQLGAAIVLHHLLTQSGQYENWSALEQMTRAFVGITDSMTFAQLGDLLENASIRSPSDVPDLVTLTNLQTRLLTGEDGVQNIHSDFLYSPLGPEQVKLPRSFTVCGQKFILDSWAFSQVVFDRILWSPDDGTKVIFGKVIRRKPSCLDVAYSVFGNDQVIPDIVARINRVDGVPFRDGLPYQHNLQAVRNTIEGQEAGIWTNNIYMAWLAAIRALSAPTTDPRYPEAMRTRAWAMKTLSTQLGSWTEQRHDTLLYAKQSYTEPLSCGYPAGFVEPRPEFWQSMKVLTDTAAAAISTFSLSGQIPVPNPVPWDPYRFVDLASIKSNQLAFFAAFSDRMAALQTIAQKELAQQPLTPVEDAFLRNTIERTVDYVGTRQWNGWYPGLFYTNSLTQRLAYPSPGCDQWDALVADVHTDLPDPIVNDPGAVIHEGIGNVHLLLIAVDNGPDRMVYAGPVLSHYEFEVPGVNRLSDEDWKASLGGAQKPLSPEWTDSYLVPGTITVPPGYE